MPTIYKYLGIRIFFYSDDHQPIHGHGVHQNKSSKAEITTKDGKIKEIRIKSVTGLKPLQDSELKNFKKFVETYAEKIVQKWVDHFVYNKRLTCETITRKL